MEILNPKHKILNNLKGSNSNILNFGTLEFRACLDIRNLKLEITTEGGLYA